MMAPHASEDSGGGQSGAGSSGMGVVVVEQPEREGVRIGEASGVVRQPEGDGPRRGRPRQEDARAHSTLGKRTVRSAKWSVVGRDAYRQVQRGNHGERFERGEGGGVT